MPPWVDTVGRYALVLLLVIGFVALGLLSVSGEPEQPGGDPPACAETLAGCPPR